MLAAVLQKLNSVYLRAQLLRPEATGSKRLWKKKGRQATAPQGRRSGIPVRLPQVYIISNEFEGAKDAACVQPLMGVTAGEPCIVCTVISSTLSSTGSSSPRAYIFMSVSADEGGVQSDRLTVKCDILLL